MVTGGEPLLHPDISSLLPALGALMPVSLISNGLALGRHASLDRVESLIYAQPEAPRCLAPWTAGLVLPDGRWSHCFFLETEMNTRDGLAEAIRRSREARRERKVDSNPTCQRCVCWRG